MMIFIRYFCARNKFNVYLCGLYNYDIYLEPFSEYTDYMLTEIWIRPTITYCLVACFVTETEK